jgi:hypothetical protein
MGSSHLPKQLDRSGIFPCSERSHPTSGKDRDRAQGLTKLACRARIEAAVGAMGCKRDVPEHVFDLLIVAFLKHEGGHAEASELVSFGNEQRQHARACWIERPV